LLLTITVRNCPLMELGATLDHIHKSWDRMAKRVFFPTTYWTRRTEVTIGRLTRGEDVPAPGLRNGRLRSAPPPIPGDPTVKDCGPKHLASVMGLGAHPHMHILLLVPPSYFHKTYVSQRSWQSQWRDAAQLDYDPIIDVRRAYAKPGAGPEEEEMEGAIRECAKYITKADQVHSLGRHAAMFHKELKNKRMIALSRPLSKFVPSASLDGAELFDKKYLPLDHKSWPKEHYKWNRIADQYIALAGAEGG
jgi:hypothetical protein